MKLCEGGTIIMVIVLTLLGLGGLVSIKFLGHDNVVEEVVEQIIEKQTGLDIDLSPSSAEAK